MSDLFGNIKPVLSSSARAITSLHSQSPCIPFRKKKPFKILFLELLDFVLEEKHKATTYCNNGKLLTIEISSMQPGSMKKQVLINIFIIN